MIYNSNSGQMKIFLESYALILERNAPEYKGSL